MQLTSVISILLSSFLILGCSSREDKLKDAREKILKAEDAIHKKNRMKSTTLLSDAEEVYKDSEVTGSAMFCEPFFWDKKNLEALLSIDNYRASLIKSVGKDADYYIVENLKSFQRHDSDIREIQRSNSIPYCSTIPVRPEYIRTASKLLALDAEVAAVFEKARGYSLKEVIRELDKQAYEYRQQNNWDSMSKQAREQATGNDPAVKSCVDAALKGNSKLEGVDNIVKDVASLCTSGLR